MAKRRLNDTAAIVDSAGSGASHSISTRQIDNGWITESYSHDPATGQCKSASVFSKHQPRIMPARVARSGSAPDSGSSLRRTMDYLKD